MDVVTISNADSILLQALQYITSSDPNLLIASLFPHRHADRNSVNGIVYKAEQQARTPSMVGVSNAICQKGRDEVSTMNVVIGPSNESYVHIGSCSAR
jgi:hypothetical protein